MHLDPAALEPSADGHKHCLVATVTVEVDKASKFMPIFKEALALCSDRNLHQVTGSRITRIQADGGGEV